MARYELSTIPWMGDAEPPFAVITTDDSGVPITIERHFDTDAVGKRLADDLIANFIAEPESFSLNRLAVSYGGLQEIDEAGFPVVDRQTAPRERLKLYLVEADTGFDGQLGLEFPGRLPLLVFAATSLDEGALDAAPVANTPSLVNLAKSFTEQPHSGQVAREQSLEVSELKGTVLVALLEGLPAEHPVAALVARLEKNRTETQSSRRVARRG